MSITELEQAQLVGIHVLYPDSSYEVGLVGEHFVGIEEVWEASLRLAFLRTTGIDPGPVWTLRQQIRSQTVFFRSNERMPKAVFPPGPISEFLRDQEGREFLSDHEKAQIQQLLLQLTIYRLRAESPMDLSIAIQGGAALGVGVYALHLLRAVLRHPELVGAWLPRLVAGWHKGMSEASEAKNARGEKPVIDVLPAIDEIEKASHKMMWLEPTRVEIAGAGEPPEDIADALPKYMGEEQDI